MVVGDRESLFSIKWIKKEREERERETLFSIKWIKKVSPTCQ